MKKHNFFTSQRLVFMAGPEMGGETGKEKAKETQNPLQDADEAAKKTKDEGSKIIKNGEVADPLEKKDEKKSNESQEKSVEELTTELNALVYSSFSDINTIKDKGFNKKQEDEFNGKVPKMAEKYSWNKSGGLEMKVEPHGQLTDWYQKLFLNAFKININAKDVDINKLDKEIAYKIKDKKITLDLAKSTLAEMRTLVKETAKINKAKIMNV